MINDEPMTRDRTHTPPPDQLAQLGETWAGLRPQLPQDYRPIIDDRLALVDSYLSRI